MGTQIDGPNERHRNGIVCRAHPSNIQTVASRGGSGHRRSIEVIGSLVSSGIRPVGE